MKLFPTEKEESAKTKFTRLVFNIWPCIWCTGSRIEFFSGDHKELHTSLNLNIRTRNRVGTVFGGSIYSSVDPHLMLMLMQILGRDYVVWDKAASVKFVRPITTKVKCRFLIPDSLIIEIKQKTQANGEYVFDLPLQYEDEHGIVYAVFTKTLYAAGKDFYKQKQAAKVKNLAAR